MKLTESQLRQVIREELKSLFSEGLWDDLSATAHDFTGGAIGARKKKTRSQIEREAEIAKKGEILARKRAAEDKKAKMDQSDKDFKAKHDKYLADTAGERASATRRGQQERERQNQIAYEKRQSEVAASDEKRKNQWKHNKGSWGDSYSDDD